LGRRRRRGGRGREDEAAQHLRSLATLTRNASTRSRWRSSGLDRIAPAGSRDRAVAPDRIRAGVVRAATDDGERCRREREREWGEGGRRRRKRRTGREKSRRRDLRLRRRRARAASATVELELWRHRIRRRCLLAASFSGVVARPASTRAATWTHVVVEVAGERCGGGGCRGTRQRW
jgi:hypothetical protein